MESTAVRFADCARILTDTARVAGHDAPAFLAPPRVGGVDRTIRGRGERAVVAVRLRARPWVAVLADMIDGVVTANDLTGDAAGALRARLWTALDVAGMLAGTKAKSIDRPRVLHLGRSAA